MKKIYSAPQCITAVVEQEDVISTSSMQYVVHRTDITNSGTFYSYKTDFGGTQS